MNLEEELKELEGIKGKKNNSDLNEIMSNYSKEQIIQVLDKLLNSNKEEIKQNNNEEPKQTANDYKDNYVLPSDDEETVGCDFNKLTEQYETAVLERKNMSNQPSTDISQLIDSAFDNIGDELELDISYRGIIKDIKLVYASDNNGKYDSIVVNYELDDNGLTKYTNDYYRFNWEYNHVNINKLVSFLKTIDGFYKDDFIAFTVEDIQKELKFLIGANISLKQKLNNNGYRENKVIVLGTFDRINRRMVDR